MQKWKMGIGMIAVLLVVAVSGCTSDTNSTTTTPAPAPEQTPTTVTIPQLYDGSIAQGTYVKVTGKCIQSDGYRIRMGTTKQDILVTGTNLNAYEDQQVTVQGTFAGPTSYDTAMGSSRTVPTIENAKIA